MTQLLHLPTDEVTIEHEEVAEGGASVVFLLIGGLVGVATLLAAAAVALVGLVFVLGAATFVLISSPAPEPMPMFPEAPVVLPAEPATEPLRTAVPAAAAPAVASGLRLAVKQTGKKTFQLVNLSGTDYTNATIVLNGEYQYRVRRLVANAGDSMRYGSFVSRKTGEPPTRKVPLRTLTVRADQGSWTGSP